MNIAIFMRSHFAPSGYLLSHFYLQLLKELIQINPNHNFFIITDDDMTNFRGLSGNIELISPSGLSRFFPGAGIWQSVYLSAVLKNKKTDLILSLDGKCLRNLNLPQCILLTDPSILKQNCAMRAKAFAVLSEHGKQDVLNQYAVPDKNIRVIYAAARDHFHPVSEDEKIRVKKKYTVGYDYFLCTGIKLSPDDFILLLKAFSIFKKRQKSNFRLVIFLNSKLQYEKYLKNYKYRNDVKVLVDEFFEDTVPVTAAAYACLLPASHELDLMPALEVMNSGVPVIAVGSPGLSITFNDAVLNARNKEAKEIGEKMIRLYTDEPFRDQLIEKGQTTAASFSWNRSANLLWQAIQSALS